MTGNQSQLVEETSLAARQATAPELRRNSTIVDEIVDELNSRLYSS